MMTIRDKHSLPRRRDLDTVVHINPDEAGIFDMFLEDSLFPGPGDVNRKDEMDLLTSGGISAEADVMDIYYEQDFDGYKATVIGLPADSQTISRWVVTFEVRS